MKPAPQNASNLPIHYTAPESIQYLMPHQLDALTEAFEQWHDAAHTPAAIKSRGRYWLTYLVLRYSGARLGEVLALRDEQDVDFRQGEIKLITLKRHSKTANGARKPKRVPVRSVPVPLRVCSELGLYIGQHPGMRGRVFKLDQGNFRRVFYRRADEAGVPRDLAHPHILRHTRAMELCRAGIPLTGIQNLLGHSSLNTTAIYLRLSNAETRQALRQSGLI